MTTNLTAPQLDRVRGALLGQATGDALGAGYEFGSAPLGPEGPRMIGGGLGGFAPGEWTDDTTMAWAVADAAATFGDLRTPAALDLVARHFRDWFDSGPDDIGVQTGLVLRRAGADPTAESMTNEAALLHAETGRTGGNGSLMRTVAVALPHLDAPSAVAEAAVAVGALTHCDRRAREACVLWSLAIRTAILDGRFDVRSGLTRFDEEAAGFWSARIDEAEHSAPGRFAPNGYVVPAFQAAWAAIVATPVPDEQPERHLADALWTAIAIGDDTDTVAAIAGALLGARWGAAAVPVEWRDVVHGYPGLTGEELTALAERATGLGS
ncbi:MAG: ADP-ribosylglycohydrolase family protein [Gordonia sp. (in: high G+C Gram-positive bacteria)]|uniref:ADP-ribosylglycohydrolase family protein n=1 Tax=Gordonia sp. (in: high G+C Gram-positive bacteria) TaxID=84139 RepID=UPI0039E64967